MNLICQNCKCQILDNFGSNITCSCILCINCLTLATNLLQQCPICSKPITYSFQLTSSQITTNNYPHKFSINDNINEYYEIDKNLREIKTSVSPKCQRLFDKQSIKVWKNQTLIHSFKEKNNADVHEICIGDIVLLHDQTQQFYVTDIQSNAYLVAQLKKINKDIFIDFQNYQWINLKSIHSVQQKNTDYTLQIRNSIYDLLRLVKQDIFQSSKNIDQYHNIQSLTNCLVFKLNSQSQFSTNLNQLNSLLFKQLYQTSTQTDKKDQLGEEVNIFNFQIGKPVVRNSQNWKFGDQDKSESSITINGQIYYKGFLVSFSETNKLALVKWENGSVQNYRIGYDDKYDLRFLDDSFMSNKQINTESNCQCNMSIKYKLLCSDLPQSEKLGFYSFVVKNQEFCQYLKDNKFDLSKQFQSCQCVLESGQFTEFNIQNLTNFVSYIRHGGKQKLFIKCKYPSYHQVRESCSRNKLITKTQINQLLLKNTSIPVQASQNRLKLPAVITISEDWHHGNQYNGKIGLLIPNSKVYSAFQACVIWYKDLQLLEQYQQMLCNFDHFYETGIIQESNIEKSIILHAHVYDAGRQNLMELQYYNLVVTEQNFQTKGVIGPSIQWQLEQGQLCGILLWQQNLWAVVLWMDGSINRHKIGQDGVYELCYLDYSLE